MPTPGRVPPSDGYATMRPSPRSRLLHLSLPDADTALCGRPVGVRTEPGQAPVCARCTRTGALHPLDRDPPGYHLAAAPTRPGLLTVIDPAGRAIGTAASVDVARFRAWQHAHTAAVATARLRRGGLRPSPADNDAWRVLITTAAGRWRRAGTVRARDDGFLADLDDPGTPTARRFGARAAAVRWICEHRVVHGWPQAGWLVLEDTRVLRHAGSRHGAARWLRGYHAVFTGLRATAIRPIGLDAYQHDYPDGSVFTLVRVTRAAHHGVDPATPPRYPYDDLPYDTAPAPPPGGSAGATRPRWAPTPRAPAAPAPARADLEPAPTSSRRTGPVSAHHYVARADGAGSGRPAGCRATAPADRRSWPPRGAQPGPCLGLRHLRHRLRRSSPTPVTTHPQGGNMSMTSENLSYAEQVGTRLRAIRMQQGCSLQQVEALSGGRWKVAAVGSYERGDRRISVENLAALADFYAVPVRALLPDARPDPLPPRTIRVVLDLPTLARLPEKDAGPLRRWVAEIQRERGDYAGRVLSIRHDDLRALAALYDLTADQLVDRLRQWQALDPTSTVPAPSDPA